MGKPARSQPVVVTRRDGSLYSSQRKRPLKDEPADAPRLPTDRALDLHGKQKARAESRARRIARFLRHGKVQS